MDIKNTDRSALFSAPGILLQMGSAGAASAFGDSLPLPTAVLIVGSGLVLGTGLLIAGLAFYAIAKSQSPLWCLLGFLSLFGLLVLAVMPDRHNPSRGRVRRR